MKIDVKECARILKAQDNIRIYCHRDPDGDTIGCAMALTDALTSMGKRVYVSCVSPIPENLKFIYKETEPFEEEFRLAVDISNVKLLGDGEIRETPMDLCIDHHVSNEFYAKDTCLYTFSSAGELVYDILTEMGVTISPYAATCLLTAITTDTGSFKYSEVTSKTLRTGAALYDLGADKDKVRQEIYESRKKSRVKIEAMAMAGMEFFENDRIAVISISLDMMEKCGAKEEELEGIASSSVSVKGVDIGFTIKERDDGYIRVSARTTEKADACKICQAFQGGGHVRASGCRIKATLEEAKEMLLAEARKQIL